MNKTLAFQYFYEAKLKGDVNGEAFVGYMYYQGLGVAQSLQKAYETFKAGESRKNYKCNNGLGLMYLKGDYVEMNIPMAYKLFKSKPQGHQSQQMRDILAPNSTWLPCSCSGNPT